MAAKREQTIWDNLWTVSEKLERKYSLKALCSAGVLVLSTMSAEDRETAIENASLYPEVAEDVVAEAEALTVKTKRTQSRRPSKSAG